MLDNLRKKARIKVKSEECDTVAYHWYVKIGNTVQNRDSLRYCEKDYAPFVPLGDREGRGFG